MRRRTATEQVSSRKTDVENRKRAVFVARERRPEHGNDMKGTYEKKDDRTKK